MIWHMGDIFDRLASHGDSARPALIHGDQRVSWGDFTRRTNNIAANLAARGFPAGTKVAFYMRNRPEYMELLIATFKARLTHVNINYRYRPQELAYILENSDSEVVVYAPEFRPIISAVLPGASKVRMWVELSEDGLPDFAVSYESLAETGDSSHLNCERDPADPILVYTGGTTGMPKGVIWTHEIMIRAQISGLLDDRGKPPQTFDEYMAYVARRGDSIVQLPAAPLMHLTGMGTAMTTLMGGGTVVTVPPADHFRAEDVWDAVHREKVTNMAIVGDTFAKPLLKALENAPGKYDVSSLSTIISSGVMWSAQVKEALLRHLPGTTLLDALASSEAPAIAMTVSNREAGVGTTLDFQVGPECCVLDEAGNLLPPGSGEIGFLARTGNMPLGYYKDEEKTAKTFKIVDGVRYVITGDICRVEADGRITLLGRNSACINTGGEKVFAEEVEEALKEHPNIDDATVVGLPDDRWGQAVMAVVAARDASAFDETALRNHVRERLANYKAPKRVFVKDSLERFPNGKANYEKMREFALAKLQEGGAS